MVYKEENYYFFYNLIGNFSKKGMMFIAIIKFLYSYFYNICYIQLLFFYLIYLRDRTLKNIFQIIKQDLNFFLNN